MSLGYRNILRHGYWPDTLLRADNYSSWYDISKQVLSLTLTRIGAKCGATAIDSRFYQLMSIKLDRAFNSLLPSSIRPGSTLMNRFEEAKHTFNGEGEKTWNLPLNIDGTKADPTFFDRRRRCIILRSQDLRDLFDPVLNKIFTLIASQITAANDKFQRQVINVSVPLFLLSRLNVKLTPITFSYRKLFWLVGLAPPHTSKTN